MKNRKIKKIYMKFSAPIMNLYYTHLYLPEKVRLEACTICQLKCTGCSFQHGGGDNLGRGYLSLENFKRFLEMNPFVREIELSNYGEIFLNPDLVGIMYHAREKGVVLTAKNGTNFNTVSEEQMRAMVETGFREVSLSIDGASQETYSRYREGGNFDTVIHNIRKLQEIKREAGSQFPMLSWQFILMAHNELDVGKAKQMANDLDLPIRFKLNWDKTYKPEHREYLMQETGLTELTEAEYEASHEVHRYNGICQQIFMKPQINWDGRLIGCCTRHYATFDVNVFEVGIQDAIHTAKYMQAKHCLLKTYPEPAKFGECVCFNCEYRQIRERSGKALQLPGIRSLIHHISKGSQKKISQCRKNLQVK